jgi:predicted extracellular nuclease
MKKIIFIALLLTQFIMLSQKQITIMFYNTENFFDTVDDPKTQDEEYLPGSEMEWNQTKYKNKIARIAQVVDSSVAGIGLPDVVGFCEIENVTVLKDLISNSSLKTNAYTAIATTGLDTRGINNGLIYNTKVFDLVSSVELNATNSSLGEYKTRNVLLVTLKHKATNEQLCVFVNHWPSRRDGEKETEPKRKYAAQVVRNKIDELQKQNPLLKLLVMGDLNDYPTNASVLTTLNANASPKKNTNELLNPFYSFEKKQEGTHYDRGQWHVFDQIILSQTLLQNKGINFKTNNAFVLKKDFVLFKNFKTGEIKPNRTYGPGNKYYNGYSDHLAVYIKLDF